MGLALVASVLALVGAAVLVVLRYQAQVSFPLELMLRQGTQSALDYAEHDDHDAAAAGRRKGQPEIPPSPASGEPPQAVYVPLADTADMTGFDPTRGRVL